MSDSDTEAALREMSRTIGGLESTVKTLVSTWQTQEANASQGRRDLHQKFDSISEKVSSLTAKLDAAIRDITEIKPSVEAFESAKEQAKGAGKLGRWLFGGIGFLGTALGYALANWITIGPKPPMH